MGKYFHKLNPEIQKYFKILSEDYPEWLEEYINTKEMMRISKISLSCGADYSPFFNVRYWYSNLEHSVGVALIIWNFTHDKKQTLSGLFHDIATPVFKHCIDFMNNDSEKQESTEARTREILENSYEINQLLKKDNIKLEEVVDYKIYEIADNNMPKLSADRFEYTFSSGLTFYRIWELDKIKKIYEDIVVSKNEEGNLELCFKHTKICEDYINTIRKLWPQWVSDSDRTVMQFLADIVKSLYNIGEITIDDLYTLSEQEIIKKIENSSSDYIKTAWSNFKKCTTVNKSKEKINNKYCINVKAKTRYIDPITLEDTPKRISKKSKQAKKQIEEYLNMKKGGYYTYFDFDFKPL